MGFREKALEHRVGAKNQELKATSDEMEKTIRTQEVSGAGARDVASLPASTAAQSWMVWLQARPSKDPDPARAGLDPDRQVHALGRCLFVLPHDGEAYSWCRRGGRAALLSGHLLNREEIQKRLELPTAPTPSDAELLLAAYETWGADAAQQLDGAFAAVVWDEANDVLLCVRDPIGIKPLFYAHTGAGLVLSSDIWTLLRHPHVPREINRLLLAQHMLRRYAQMPVEETFFARVRRLPGGHRLLARGTDLAVERYWDPLPPPGQPMNWTDRAELGRFPEVMHQTVASYMARGPTAIALSAGIDSVSVAVFAVEVAEEHGWPRPLALGIHFDDPTCDESAGQRAVAEALGMPFRLLSFADCLGGRPLLEAALELLPANPSPLINILQPLHNHLIEVARSQGIRVVLTGVGGDECFYVPPLLAADLMRAGDFEGLWRLYRSFVRSYDDRSPDGSPTRVAREMFWRWGLRQVLKDAAYRHVPGWVIRRRRPVTLPDWIAPDPELRRQLCDRLQPPPPQAPVDSVYLRFLRAALQHPLAIMELEQLDDRARGREICYGHPYWSRSVVELMFRTPPHLLIEGGRSKGFVRRMLAARLPQLGFERQKKVMLAPFAWRQVAQEWSPIWRRWAADSALACAGVVDGCGLETVLKASAAHRVEYVAHCLSTEAWLRAQR